MDSINTIDSITSIDSINSIDSIEGVKRINAGGREGLIINRMTGPEC